MKYAVQMGSSQGSILTVFFVPSDTRTCPTMTSSSVFDSRAIPFVETSISLANHSTLVHMDRVQPGTRPLSRLAQVPGAYSGIWWYADYPDHYAGDANPATIEKGRKLRELQVNALAKFIKSVKEDTVTSALEQEFFDREANLRD